MLGWEVILWGISFGDIDGDGDLDIAVANWIIQTMFQF
jgi:hypothetical protein